MRILRLSYSYRGKCLEDWECRNGLIITDQVLFSVVHHSYLESWWTHRASRVVYIKVLVLNINFHLVGSIVWRPVLPSKFTPSVCTLVIKFPQNSCVRCYSILMGNFHSIRGRMLLREKGCCFGFNVTEVLHRQSYLIKILTEPPLTETLPTIFNWIKPLFINSNLYKILKDVIHDKAE